MRRVDLGADAAHQALGHGGGPDHRAALDGGFGIVAQGLRGRYQRRIGQFGRAGKECLGREHQARGDGAASVGSARVHHVDVGGSTKVHHNHGRSVARAGRDGVSDAVGANLMWVGQVDGNAAVARGVNHERLATDDLAKHPLPGLREDGDDARDGNVGDVGEGQSGADVSGTEAVTAQAIALAKTFLNNPERKTDEESQN